MIFIHNQTTKKIYQESSPGVNGLAPHQNSHGPTIPPNHATFSRGKLPSLLLMGESPRHSVKEISSHFQVEWVVLGMWAREWRSITCFIDVLLVGGAGWRDATEMKTLKGEEIRTPRGSYLCFAVTNNHQFINAKTCHSKQSGNGLCSLRCCEQAVSTAIFNFLMILEQGKIEGS